MTKRKSPLDDLEKHGIKNISTLRTLLYLDTPRTMKEVDDHGAMTRRGLELFMKRVPGIITRKKIKETRGYLEGRPSEFTVTLTNKGKKLVAPFSEISN